MNRLKKHLGMVLAGALTVCASQTHALPTGFTDLGDTTVDASTGLEWLDVTITRNRDASVVLNEISNSGVGALSDQDWRYATLTEARALVSTWFGFTYFGGTNTTFPGINTDLVNDFINTFGDTWELARQDLGFNWDVISGEVKGYVDTGAGSVTTEFALADREYIDLVSGQAHDFGDILTDFHRTSRADIWKGSWLVRNYAGASTASEPGVLALFSLGLLGLGLARRRK